MTEPRRSRLVRSGSASSRNGERLQRLLIEAMAKHLPPSAASLRLVDLQGATSTILSTLRPDVEITAAPVEALATLPEATFDAITAYDVPLVEPFLSDAMRLLRPGGRLITIDSVRDPDEATLQTLEASGYVRILVEMGAECPLPVGMLARGEKEHVTDDTLARVRVAADRDTALIAALESVDPDSAPTVRVSRYLHLLVQQTPNRPVWARQPDEPITWRAAGMIDSAGTRLLAFTSLPSAVAFMQPAVVKGTIRDVNKVAKFKREIPTGWSYPLLINPALDTIDPAAVQYIDIDPATAEQSDE